MRTKFPFGLFLLFVILILVVACESSPTPRAEIKTSPTKPAVPTTSSEPIAAHVSATSTPPPPAEEEDCMAGCHIPDPNEEFANGADPQPSDHTGYKVCVECHLKLAKPVFPTTHTGRMDAACPLCHVLEAKSK